MSTTQSTTSVLASVAREAIASVDPIQPAPANAPAASAPAAQPSTPEPGQASAEVLANARAEGASAERLRVKAILSGPESEGRSALAQHLAFETGMSAEAAQGVLAASPRGGNAARSLTGATVPQPAVASVEPEKATGGTPTERLAAACKALTVKAG